MVNFKYQGWTMVVARVDIVILFLHLIAVLVVTVQYFTNGFTFLDQYILEISSKDDSLRIILAIFCAVVELVIGIQIWVAMKLLAATDPGMKPETALEHARFWTQVAVVYIIFPALGYVVSGNIYIAIFNIVWRGATLGVVSHFMMELSRYIASKAGNTHLTPNIERI